MNKTTNLTNNLTNSMVNFTLTFGKYATQDLFSTPQNYQEWLLKQKFVVRQNEFDNLKEGDKIVFNYRYKKYAHEIGYQYEGIVCNFIKQSDKHIVVSYPSNVSNEILTHKYLKSTIASINVL